MATPTKLDQAWKVVERLSRRQQKTLAARMNALLALPLAEKADAGVRPNTLTMEDIRVERQAARQRRHEKTRERRA
jgi:hypothetical protein